MSKNQPLSAIKLIQCSLCNPFGSGPLRPEPPGGETSPDGKPICERCYVQSQLAIPPPASVPVRAAAPLAPVAPVERAFAEDTVDSTMTEDVVSDLTANSGSEDVDADTPSAELHFSAEELRQGLTHTTTTEESRVFTTLDGAIEACKGNGSLRQDGRHKGAKYTTHYLKCGKVARRVKGATRDDDCCQADFRVVEDPVKGTFTANEKRPHRQDCPFRNKSHGMSRTIRSTILEHYKTPADAQTARIANLPNLQKIRNLFDHANKRDSQLSNLSEAEVRVFLIAEAKARRPASEHEWIDTLVINVREWETNRTGRRGGNTYTIPCYERIITITLPNLLGKFGEYNISGLDGTYGLSTKHAVILNIGVYHDRAFLPLLIAISSSRHSKLMEEDTPIPNGESQRHYETLLSMTKEQAPHWNPTLFMRDGAPQIHNAVEKTFPGVPQDSCYFHFQQALHRWITCGGGKHLLDRIDEIHELFRALHYASNMEDLDAGLSVLRVYLPDPALWKFLETSQRLPGQPQSNWWFAGSEHGSPKTACALEASNKVLGKYAPHRGKSSISATSHACCNFIMDTETRTTFTSREGIPRIHTD